jgi:hypothetical protein
VDGNNNIIVAGTANTGSGIFRFYVRKLNTVLAKVWDVVPIDTGGDGGATGVAVDSTNNVVATGLYTEASGHHGFYTVKLGATLGDTIWTDVNHPVSSDFIGTATGVAIGPDNNPVVTGYLDDASGTSHIRTIKYTSAGFFSGAVIVWDITDDGSTLGDSLAHQIATDGSSNTIIVGETENPDRDNDIYVAKYDALTGTRLYASTFAGSFGTDATGVDVAVDGNGGVAITGVAFRNFNGTGRSEIATIKYNRLLVVSGDELPDDQDVPANAKYSAGNAPAVSDNGAVAARVTVASGKTKLSAIFTQGAAGGTSLPAVQKGTAPDVAGAKFASFSDPVIAPNGRYAFAAKISGAPKANANGVWTDLSGSLKNALQQGLPVPGLPTANVAGVMSLSVRNNQLLALLKVSGPKSMSTVLLGLSTANAGTVLLRTGQAVTVNGTASTIKSITVLSPAAASPGDGRWQGDANTVARVTLADKRTVIYAINTGGGLTPLLFSEQDASAVVAGAAWKTFGLPAIGTAGSKYAALGTLAPKSGAVTNANDTALVYSATGAGFTAFAKEGAAPNDPSLNTLTYSAFSDPLVNANGDVAFVATLKGSHVGKTNNRAVLFGPPAGTLGKVARTGDPATDAAGQPGTPVWSAFKATALSGGTDGAPIFLATLSGGGINGKNNLGVWAVDSRGDVRRLLRTGDKLGDQVVSKITLLNTVSTAFAAARSFNATGTIAALVTFTDKTQALLKIGIP